MSRAKGLTLVEVVAALVLLASAVTTLLTVQGRSLQQLRDAREQTVAAQLAQELITQWKLQPRGYAPPDEGIFETQPGWRWTRSSVPWRGANTLKLIEITLSIIRRDDSGFERIVTTLTWLENKDAA